MRPRHPSPLILLAALLLEPVVPRMTSALPPGAEPPVEAISFSGHPLARPSLPDEFRERQEGLLEAARRRLEQAPADPDAAIWVGRRTAYLGRYREAIDLYSRAIAEHPDYAPLYRHRGHRYLTVRQVGSAIADLTRAAALVRGEKDVVEEDGLPNDRGIPTSTLQTNIWYHLGLAHYLVGDFERSAAAFRTCLELASNADMRVAASYWVYLSLRRLGEHEAAAALLEPITPELEIIENHDYFRLLRAFGDDGAGLDELLGDGEGGVESATRTYGAGAWFLVEGDRARARSLFERTVAGEAWAAFGYLAAEAELSRADPS